MKIEREAYEYEVEGGTLYVTVEMAKRKTEVDWKNDERQTIETLIPRVRISSDPKFRSEVEHGFLKVRGRKYTTEYTYDRLPDGQGHLDRHGLTMNWSTDVANYSRGRRNDKGKQLDYETVTYGVLAKLEVATLKRFEAEHPDWKTESIRLRFEWERDSHDVKAKQLQERAEKEQAEASRWQKRIDELAA
ncbi:hypothetical protein [Streptomyces sp. NPDC004788]